MKIKENQGKSRKIKEFTWKMMEFGSKFMGFMRNSILFKKSLEKFFENIAIGNKCLPFV